MDSPAMPIVQNPIEQAGYGGPYASAIEDAVHKWEMLTGFMANISNDQLVALARAQATSEFAVGQVMSGMAKDASGNSYVTPTADQQKVLQGFYGAAYGLSNDAYDSRVRSFQEQWQQLTGQDIRQGTADEQGAWNDNLNKNVLSRGADFTASEWAQQLKLDENMNKTYGWLKYGQDYTQFKQSKSTFELSVGHPVSNDVAVAEIGLQKFASQGGSGEAKLATAQNSAPEQQKGQSAVR